MEYKNTKRLLMKLTSLEFLTSEVLRVNVTNRFWLGEDAEAFQKDLGFFWDGEDVEAFHSSLGFLKPFLSWLLSSSLSNSISLASKQSSSAHFVEEGDLSRTRASPLLISLKVNKLPALSPLALQKLVHPPATAIVPHDFFCVNLKFHDLPFSSIRTISPHLVSRPFAFTKRFGRFWKIHYNRYMVLIKFRQL